MAPTCFAGGVQHAAAAPSVCSGVCSTLSDSRRALRQPLLITAPCTQFVADENGELVVLGEGATGICYLASAPVGDVAVKVRSTLSSMRLVGWALYDSIDAAGRMGAL